MVKNLKLGDLSITGLNDINRFSIPVKNLFPDFDDSILRKNDPLPESVMSKGLIHLTIRSWLLRQSGKNILIADDKESFAKNIIQLLDNKNELTNLGRSARKRVEEQYSNSAKVGELLEFYKKLIG